MPAAHGFTECLRLSARSGCRSVSGQPVGCLCSRRPPLHSRDAGNRDELVGARRLAGGHRRPLDGAVASRERAVGNATSCSNRLRSSPCTASADPVRERPGPGGDGLHPDVGLRACASTVGLCRRWIPRGRCSGRRKRPSAAVDDRSESWFRRYGRHRTYVAERGRQPLRRLVLERSGSAANADGGVGSAAVDLPSLAALAGSR